MRSSPEEICLLHMKDEGSRQNRKKTYKETQKKLWERRGQNRTEKKLEEFVASAKRNRSDKALFAIEDEFNSS
jgi:benzoyl-CoA reductase/2-hydroxyglutaryl-CoA dehydratase subunit BcrC/BadD/HgdB